MNDSFNQNIIIGIANPLQVGLLEYLTPQDILWINLEITGATNELDAELLEEAASHLYSYVKIPNPIYQVGDFLETFLRIHPFNKGNQRTAFISMLAFLTLNGYEFIIPGSEVLMWIKSVEDKRVRGLTAIRTAIRPSVKAPLDLRTLVLKLIVQYHSILDALTFEENSLHEAA